MNLCTEYLLRLEREMYEGRPRIPKSIRAAALVWTLIAIAGAALTACAHP